MIERIDIIRKAYKKQLRDQEWLEDAICRMGLGQRDAEFPFKMRQYFGGLYIWQYPNQIAPYLIELSNKKIKTYAEIGVFQGGTFILTVEYLSRFTPIEAALVIDKELQGQIKAYAELNPAVTLLEAYSHSDEARAAMAELKPDLVFIDADHEEWACRADYNLARRYAKWIGFHDLVEWSCPGVARVWNDVKGDKHEYLAQYDGVKNSTYGVGLVKNVDV